MSNNTRDDAVADTTPPPRPSRPKTKRAKRTRPADEEVAVEVAADITTPKPQKTARSENRKGPEEWAVALGLVRYVKFPYRMDIHDWRHNAASALHRWPVHIHHAGGPIQLTREDYEAALEAVTKPPPYKPHPAAKSQH